MNSWKVLFAVLALVSTGNVLGVERTAGEGSLIIPMDSKLQDPNSGIYHAYGFVVDLLEGGATIHWAIDENKEAINSIDFTVPGDVEVINGLTATPEAPIAYLGGPWIIESGEDADLARTLLDDYPDKYGCITVHESSGAFTYNSSRVLQGSLPKLALINDKESYDDGNAVKILQCYLELAQIGSGVYEVVTPNDVRDGVLESKEFSLAWAPHWEGHKHDDIDTIMTNISAFVDKGNALFAECASIETFEHHENGRFLSTNEFSHNGGTNDAADIQYLDFTQPYSQIGDFPFVPTGGHLHNWRPYQPGDPISFDAPSGAASKYVDSATVFTTDATGSDGLGWDYFVGGRKDNDPAKGYVIYLGGHSYCKVTAPTCDTDTPDSGEADDCVLIKTEIKNCKKGSKDHFFADKENLAEIEINFTYWTQEEYLNKDDYSNTSSSKVGPLGYDDDGNKIVGSWADDFFTWTAPEDINYGPGCNGNGDGKGFIWGLLLCKTSDYVIRIDDMKVSLKNTGDATFEVKGFEFRENNEKCGNNGGSNYGKIQGKEIGGNDKCGQEAHFEVDHPDKKKDEYIMGEPVVATGDDDDDDDDDGAPLSQWTGGIRYVLNTLFNLQFDIAEPREFARSSAVVSDDIAYFGTFEYPGYKGHFRAYDVKTLTEKWDSAKILPSYGSRPWFTFLDDTKTAISPGTTDAALITALGTTEEAAEDLISAILGKGQSNWLGGIHRSTPAIITQNGRSTTSSSRDEIAYFGTAFGTLEMIDLADGTEYGGYVPKPLLSQLERVTKTGVGAYDAPYPIVDSAPNVTDAFVRVGESEEREWRTVLTMGFGGTTSGSYALDITDPAKLSLLWENDALSDGRTLRTSVAPYKQKKLDEEGEAYYELAYMTLASADTGKTGSAVQVHAYDLYTGESFWTFSKNTEVEDMPGAVALYDKDGDRFFDHVFVGDTNGRIWMIDILDGTIPSAVPTESTDPLIDAGKDSDGQLRPIMATPSIGVLDHDEVLVYGTGGADWTNSDENFVAVYDLHEHKELYRIDIGALKIYAPIIIVDNKLFFKAIDGSLFSADPSLDLPTSDSFDDNSVLVQVIFDKGTTKVTRVKSDKGSSSPYVSNGQLVDLKMDGTVGRYLDYKESNSAEQLRTVMWLDLTNRRPQKAPEVVAEPEAEPEEVQQ